MSRRWGNKLNHKFNIRSPHCQSKSFLFFVSRHPCINKVMDFGVDILVFYVLSGLQNILLGANGIAKVKNAMYEVIVHYIYC